VSVALKLAAKSPEGASNTPMPLMSVPLLGRRMVCRVPLARIAEALAAGPRRPA
jgi:hypothetical protein